MDGQARFWRSPWCFGWFSSRLCGRGAAEWRGGGPEIGWVRTLLETSDGTLYAGTWGGGIFRSANGGRSWTEATSNAGDTVVLDLAEGIDPQRALYAATLDRSLMRKEQSSDFWNELGRFPIGSSPPGISIEIFPFRDTRIAFGSDAGVFVSSDRGNTWPDTLTFVREGLSQYFERPIAPLVSPEDAVALGAGLYAARLARHPARKAHA